MAVNKDPILKRCRYLGISPAVVGIDKKSWRKPNANGRKKVSEYGMQLKEKQKLKFIYGVLEKQFYHYYEIATKMEGQAGTNIIVLLESRLDNVVYRMGFALTRREARQLVTHGHYTLNGKKVNSPSLMVKAGDVIAVKAASKNSPKFKEIQDLQVVVPSWMDVDLDKLEGKILALPKREEIDTPIQEHLIVELYSK